MGVGFGNGHNLIGELSLCHIKRKVIMTAYVPRMFDPPKRQKIIYQGTRSRYDWYIEFYTMRGLFNEVVWL